VKEQNVTLGSKYRFTFNLLKYRIFFSQIYMSLQETNTNPTTIFNLFYNDIRKI